MKGWLVRVISETFLIGWRNWSLGRADLKGAALTAATVGLADMGGRLFAYSHALDSAEYGSFFMALANSAAGAMLIAAIYLAAEPFVRRHWPEVLISWLRLLNGGFRDPLVGRHVLIGFATAAWVGVISLFQLARHPFSREIGSLGWLSGTARAIAQLLYSYSAAVSPAFFVLLPVLLLYVLLRRRILAAIIVGVMFTVILSLGSVDPVFTTAEIAIGATAILVLLLRCGFLAMVAQFFWQSIAGSLIWTLDSQAWYFGYAVLGMAVLLTLSVLAFRFALAGHPLWKEHP